MPHYGPRPFDSWPAGAVVSLSIKGTVKTGTVFILNRKADGKPFRKVQMDGPDGQRVWPDGWVLGAGRCLHQCLECEQAFRTDLTDQDWCPLCEARFQRDARAASDTRSVKGSLRGARTPMPSSRASADEEARREEDIAKLKARDAEESLF